MSKYLEFKQVPFKGKTKRFEVVSKTSFEKCKNCNGQGNIFQSVIFEADTTIECPVCESLGNVKMILGRIQWYSQWRQYVFMPGYPTIWNRDCMNNIIFFITNLMKDRKVKPTVACNPDYIFLGESKKEKKKIKDSGSNF